MKHKINRTCQTGLLFVLGLIHGSAQSETLTTLRGVAPLEVDQPLTRSTRKVTRLIMRGY